jgi:hypothetical protein
MLLICIASIGKGKQFPLVNMPYKGSTVYHYSKSVLSLSELPDFIQRDVDTILYRAFGDMSRKVQFSHGQIVDIDRTRRSGTHFYDYGWIMPAYDLVFMLRDTAIGINVYYFSLHLDQYGQVLKLEWPRSGYDREYLLKKSHEHVAAIAIGYMRENKYSYTDYSTELVYDNRFGAICWRFIFSETDSTKGMYHRCRNLLLDAKTNEVMDDYFTERSVKRN